MSQRPWLFRQRDISRALRAAQAAGITARVEITRDGTICIVPVTPQEAAAEKSPFDAWKDERDARSA